MSRSVMRFVVHSITHEPQGGLTAQTFCVTHGCGEDSGPRAEADEALDWALQHTGRTGHDLFRREYTDHARVTAHA
ncbi:hypothetical protein [Streptomyces sp. NBC_01637]|uniref:DUF7848 domain-containing protein n=1 Tax=unclassified Streptomyces TaxID=2593676 RepID=UPI00386B1A2E|nr:hypothetical protein OH719_25525 [Streptomyces sp. NBC_01653]WTD89942.1 hypothetical protein OG891_21345 [Streptomyces sp. NBC_01637]